jgi:3',5'-cyclic-AMP phosphodiesterase
MKFIHLTDTHLVDPDHKLHGLDTASRFVAAIDSINTLHADAECCVISGDLTDAGEKTAYQFLQDQVNNSQIPCYLAMGNHDLREHFLSYFPNTPVDENGFIQYTVKTSAGMFVILDTVQEGSHSGHYCESRQLWLKKTLDDCQNSPVYLFMHHPPFDIHMPCLDKIGLINKKEFSDIVTTYSNVRHIFFGHAHRPLSGSWNGIPFSSLRGTNHQVELDFNAEEITYVDEPPEYNVVFIADESVVVHSHLYLSESPHCL